MRSLISLVITFDELLSRVKNSSPSLSKFNLSFTMEEYIIVHNEFGNLKTEFSQNTENRSNIINQMKQNLISRNGDKSEITINNIIYNIDTITIDNVSDLFLIDSELYHYGK